MKPPRCGRVGQLTRPGTLVLLVMSLHLVINFLGKQVAMVVVVMAQQPNESNLKFDPQSSSYQGLTFTFDPRLDKQVEQRLHFDHWQQIMQQSSSLLYDSLQGRAHLSEVQVLIPFKWRQQQQQHHLANANELKSVLYKPGAPIIANRRLRFSDSDVIVGFEDPIYKETPFSMQHDECGRPGLNIRMPISFLDHQPSGASSTSAGPKANSAAQLQALDSRLKARQFVREFASHRYGLFKESGFRSDFMYPPFSSIAGLGPLDLADAAGPPPHLARRHLAANGSEQNHLSDQLATISRWVNGTEQEQQQLADSQHQQQATNLRGFDEHFRECKFETSPASGLPANAQAANCLPYLIKPPASITSFNLMSADPFSYVAQSSADSNQQQPVSWPELAEQTKWHFCGENFANPNYTPLDQQQQQQQQQVSPQGGSQAAATKQAATVHFEHNQRATNKQNKMCHERSALEVIKSSEDFRNHQQFSSTANFYRLPAPNFKFLQEMPPRLILAVEYTAHLFQSRRLDHAILESAINKFLALDLIAESELATVVFGQHQSRLLGTSGFQRLDSSLSSRFTLFNPALDPFDEQVVYYSPSELEQVGIQSSGDKSTTSINAPQSSSSSSSSSLKIPKGSSSFARMMIEVNALLAKSSQHYDDLGADLVVVTSGLFVEDESKIEEILLASNFKPDQHRLNMILYPSSMLFDTKTREGLIVLDSQDSEQLIRQRINKLLTIQRLAQGRLHLIREQLDSTGDVRMSTLMQFYQIFDQLAKGHSWDQTNSLAMIASQQVDSRLQTTGAAQSMATSGGGVNGQQHKLSFQFQLDESVQNELIIGFIDPKVQQPTHHLADGRSGQQQVAASRAGGKRFSLKNLQLRSPSGHFVFTETSTLWTNQSYLEDFGASSSSSVVDTLGVQTTNKSFESAFFPYRAQLSLAAFHLKPWHLANLQAQRRLAGTWTLTATSDEPIQTSGLAMARVNPEGDTLTGRCWIQSYYQTADSASSSQQQDEQSQLKMVKVFMEAQGGNGRPQELSARMEVQDEMGNIVQNVQMLDDGLGAPDMTQNDGIHSQYVQRAARSGFYKVSVELTTGSSTGKPKVPTLDTQSGQDNVCCGSFVPSSPPTSGQLGAAKSTRQLYCGTFHVEAQNKLAQQRPPRTSNLTVVNVDQENRRVTIRWFEPQLDISSSQRLGTFTTSQRLSSSSSSSSQLVAIASDNDLQQEETEVGRATRSLSDQTRPLGRRHAQDSDELDPSQDDLLNTSNNQLLGSNVLIGAGGQQQQQRPGTGSGLLADQILVPGPAVPHLARYDIKLFTDRDIIKRTFDSKQEVGFKFNEWTVEGQFPNASQFGGMKEVTLRVPFAREGFYYIAMKTHNNIGLASQMSNIIQFYLRNNLTSAELESIYLAPGTTMDAAGNVYDAQGVLVQRASSNGQLNSGYSLLRGTGALDGLSMLILFSVLAFMMTILCCTLLACLISSARHSLKAANKQRAAAAAAGDNCDTKKLGGISSIVLPGAGTNSGGEGPISAGSGSSMVSSSGGCESSEAGVCSASSSLAGSEQQTLAHLRQGGGHEHENKLLFEELTSYNKLRQVHKSQQQQAQFIHQQLISTSGQSLANQQQQQQQQEFYSQPQQQHQQPQYYTTGGPQHTIVNGYTYATVMQAQQQPQQQQQQQHYSTSHYGDLGQHHQQQLADIPTSSALGNPVQSWPADILLSHYDKVKQARERNEAPPVMRIETLEHNTNGLQYSDGLPVVFEDQDSASQQQKLQSYSRPQPPVPATATNNYLNQQLQQQLSSVLAGKRQSQNQEYDIDIRGTSPALEGVTSSELGGSNSTSQQEDHNQTLHGMPPPPQYIYCTPPGGAPIDTNGLGNQLSDPTIYSQSTNLQQVVSSGNFYANHHQWSPSSAGGGSGGNQYVQTSAGSNIYSTALASQQQQQLQHGDSAISEV